jgi:hypothetical protein
MPFTDCHPERSEEAKPTNVVEGSAVRLQRKILPRRRTADPSTTLVMTNQ